jgi:hypothetical protein
MEVDEESLRLADASRMRSSDQQETVYGFSASAGSELGLDRQLVYH